MEWDDPSKKPIQIKKAITMMMDVEISDGEMSILGRQVDDRLCDMEELEVREIERRKAYKEKHTSLWQEAKEFRLQIRTGYRKEPMVVDVLADWRTGRMKITRAGTDVVIEDRAMTAEEKQTAML